MKVALVTEGTYPLHHGGVAAWCDQLVRGLPELRFEVVALSGSGREPFALTPPSNVTAVRRVGLWARVPPGRPFTGRTVERFVGAYAQMFEAVLREGHVARAAARLPGRVVVADAVALPVPDGVLDAVTYVWVLHHVGDARACLAEAWRALRPGGRVVSVAGLPLPVDDDLAPSFDALVDVLRPGHRERAFSTALRAALPTAASGWCSASSSSTASVSGWSQDAISSTSRSSSPMAAICSGRG